MVDRHIDYNEVSEYGRHCVTELQKLSGASALVDTDTLAKRLLDAITAVETERAKAHAEQSDLRMERNGTSDAELAARVMVSRFFYFLQSLPASVDFDFDAFFPSQVLGELGRIKPADLRARVGQLLGGFDVTKNKTVAALAPWKNDLSSAHQNLGDALGGKGSAKSRSFVATKSLVDARLRFLRLYNGITKPLVRGLLADLGRPQDEKLFFLDLTVNENAPKRAPAPQTESAPL